MDGGEKITINRVMARAFINSLQFALVTASTPGLDEASQFQFKRLTDAQLSVMHSMAMLVTNKAEVFEEYDRTIEMLEKVGGGHLSPTIRLMQTHRPTLETILKSGVSH